MSKLKVSIAMATYNGERFLKEQLDSFAQQTLLPIELVVCDDVSTDHTLEILNQFAAKAPFPVKIHRNTEKLGVRDNFLRALELCVGDLVAFSDQDDVWLPGKLAACVAYFESDDVSIVTHNASLVGPALEPLGRSWPYRAKAKIEPSLSRRGYAGSAMMFRRRCAAPLLRDPELRHAFPDHDHAVGLVAAAGGTEVRCQEVLSLHRCHDTNTSASHDTAPMPFKEYVGRAHGFQKRLAAAAHWVRTHFDFALASATGADSYAQTALGLGNRASLFLRAAARADCRLRLVLEEHGRLLQKRSDAFAERSLLYRDTPGKARARLLRMVLRGRYRLGRNGGFGKYSLCKDIALLFRSARRAQVAEDQKPLDGVRRLEPWRLGKG